MNRFEISSAVCLWGGGFLFMWIFSFYLNYPYFLIGIPLGCLIGFLIYASIAFVFVKAQKTKNAEEIAIKTEKKENHPEDEKF